MPVAASRRAKNSSKKASGGWPYSKKTRACLADYLADKSFDLFILAVLEEALLETRAGDSRFDQFPDR